jgi:hypothetical protein
LRCSPLNIHFKEKPKICAIDLDQEIVEAIRAKNLSCFSGTLGAQIKVPNLRIMDAHYCLLNFDFPPNLHEYDIVIVDLRHQEPIEYIESEQTHLSFKESEQPVLLCRYPARIFDPRPLSSSLLSWKLKDFFSPKTLVIVFCSAEETSKYHTAKITPRGLHGEEVKEHSLYEFIPFLESNRNKTIKYNKTGRSVEVLPSICEEIRSFLHKYSKDFIYEIVFNHPVIWTQNEWAERNNFIPLLLNSNNEIIGFIDSSLKSSIFAFPQLQNNKKNFLLEFIDEILPALFSEIFPYSEQFFWLNLESYFLPNQSSLLEKKVKIENEYKAALAGLEKEIEENQSKYNFLHDLITETGDNLVKSVEYFLGASQSCRFIKRMDGSIYASGGSQKYFCNFEMLPIFSNGLALKIL